ncbi:RNA polymerase sigma factor [Membranihabitans maritimus]|uniref:RNA polymerase sigma factor n=1 Tax=Membranihabitans maritimus TaxID=2904244 RepID=UPI001EFFAB05|nr:RNA polymerase sigma-70 factor [Membranihabitans maritimus]
MDEIIKEYRKRVFGFLINYIKLKSEAEDLTQDVMVKVWSNRDKFEEVKDLDSYILTIAHHVVMDHFKRMHRQKEYKEKVWEATQKSENTVLKEVLQNDLISELESVLKDLPPRQQKVYRMNRIDGLSLDEISKKLDISPYTVKNHLAQATQKIKTRIKPEYFLLLAAYAMM